MTRNDGSREESAIASVLAGDFRAVIAGTADTGFAEKVKSARSDLRKAAHTAAQKGRDWPSTTVVRVPAAPWGWADFSVTVDVTAAPLLLAVGVVAPGHDHISELALSHDIIPVRAQAAAAGVGGIVAGGAIGGFAEWPWQLGVTAAAGLGAAGIAGQITWYRARIRNRRLSFRRQADDPGTPALMAALAVLMKLVAFLKTFDRDMAHQADSRGVQRISLEPRTTQVPGAIHQALWELGTHTTRDSGEDVLAAIRAAAAAAVADVSTAWRAFDSFLPARLDEPEPPAAPTAATPAKDLRELADSLEQERNARLRAIADVQQINRRLQD